MAYVAVTGGQDAIRASIERLNYERFKRGPLPGIKAIIAGFRGLIDQVMSEASLYDETLAALAIKQAEGSPEEAVFLLRAFRSTLQRNHYSRVLESDTMIVERRISAAYKDIPGGQILGASYDYTHRLIDFQWLKETQHGIYIKDFLNQYLNQETADGDETDLMMPKVIDFLRSEGFIDPLDASDDMPKDVTKSMLTFPSHRSERLQVLTRGQTGAVITLGYASLRGYGTVHPTVGELRVGALPVTVDSPFSEGQNPEDAYFIGTIKVTEVEAIIPSVRQREDGSLFEHLDVGYGICYGQNESKAIAMSILDCCLETPGGAPTHDEEFVLYHIDSVEATGFISHLKLPHYVTFQSKLDSIRKTRKVFT